MDWKILKPKAIQLITEQSCQNTRPSQFSSPGLKLTATRQTSRSLTQLHISTATFKPTQASEHLNKSRQSYQRRTKKKKKKSFSLNWDKSSFKSWKRCKYTDKGVPMSPNRTSFLLIHFQPGPLPIDISHLPTLWDAQTHTHTTLPSVFLYPLPVLRPTVLPIFFILHWFGMARKFFVICVAPTLDTFTNLFANW